MASGFIVDSKEKKENDKNLEIAVRILNGMNRLGKGCGGEGGNWKGSAGVPSHGGIG